MLADVVLLPSDLRSEQLTGRSVIVFDVLRATTSMTAALAAGIREIRIFGDLESARAASGHCSSTCLLAGEQNAVKPPGFDLGNSPGAFKADLHRDKMLLMSTTNGTRAILAAMSASAVFAGALVNARAAASAAAGLGRDVTLLCAGTQGHISLEDVLGAGAVLDALGQMADVELASDIAWIARGAFDSNRDRLAEALRSSRGGQNVLRAGLEPDIDFCAALNALPMVGIASGNPSAVRLWESQT